MEKDPEYDPHNDKEYNEELDDDKEDIKWHPKLTDEQIEELIAEKIYPGDNEYNMYLWNHGINPFDKESEKSEPVKSEPVKSKTEPEPIENEPVESEPIEKPVEPEEKDPQTETKKQEEEKSWFKKIIDSINRRFSFIRTKKIPENTEVVEIDENWRIVDHKEEKKEKHEGKSSKSKSSIIRSKLTSLGRETIGGFKIAGTKLYSYFKGENEVVTKSKEISLREKYFTGDVDHEKAKQQANKSEGQKDVDKAPTK